LVMVINMVFWFFLVCDNNYPRTFQKIEVSKQKVANFDG
jgi:hypothetical protein